MKGWYPCLANLLLLLSRAHPFFAGIVLVGVHNTSALQGWQKIPPLLSEALRWSFCVECLIMNGAFETNASMVLPIRPLLWPGTGRRAHRRLRCQHRTAPQSKPTQFMPSRAHLQPVARQIRVPCQFPLLQACWQQMDQRYLSPSWCGLEQPNIRLLSACLVVSYHSNPAMYASAGVL